MDAYKSNLIYAATLIIVGFWDYFTSINPSIAQLFPLFFGVILLSLNNGVQYGLKAQKKAAFVLTIISVFSLGYLFWSERTHSNPISIFRSIVLVLLGFISIFFYIKSFTK